MRRLENLLFALLAMFVVIVFASLASLLIHDALKMWGVLEKS